MMYFNQPLMMVFIPANNADSYMLHSAAYGSSLLAKVLIYGFPVEKAGTQIRVRI